MRIRVEGLETFYEEHGSGAPVLLVHGLGGSTAIWQLVAGPLSERFRLIAYDLRGLGRSSTPPPPYSLDVLVADLDALVGQLALERVSLVGHSLGGAIALAYAASRPERVHAAVAVSAPSVTPPEQRPMLAGRAETASRDGMPAVAQLHVQHGLPETFAEEHPDELARYRDVIAGGDPEGYGALCDVIAGLDLTAELARIRAPVLLVHGELDRIVPREAARETASRIPSCEYVELPGCGHVVPFERPGDLVRHVTRFLAAPG